MARNAKGNPRLLIATTNPGKLAEYRVLLGDYRFELPSLAEVGIEAPAPETGASFEENAILKARFYSERTGLNTLADDGGLEVDELHGAPGIRSSRWLGHDATDRELAEGILKRLDGVPPERRGARFRAVVAIAVPGREEIETFEGILRGEIANVSVREILPGLPYRSIFYLPHLGRLFSAFSIEEGAAFSHRKQAIEQARELLLSLASD
jgi:XTP/dITP diphosphohydrolase